MLLQRPDDKAPRSRLADWLELLAASQPERAFGAGEIKKILRLEEEERETRRRPDPDGEIVEGEIAEHRHDELVTDTFDELTRRSELLGDAYPFTIEQERIGLTFVNRIKWRGEMGPRNAIYLFCLIISGYRLNLLAKTAEEETLKVDEHLIYSEFMYGKLLQICACLALGGYLRGRVISFGYPRPDKTAFLPAHRAAWQEFGAYEPVTTVPLAAPNNENDAGIDLIGWLNFPDGHGSKVLVFGQVASGRNWSGKPVIGNAKGLKGWFAGPAYEHFLPVMLMPFNISDARRTVASQTGDMRPHALVYEDREFGILMDRDRVASCATAALADQTLADKIDNFGEIDQVTNWVAQALAGMQAENA